MGTRFLTFVAAAQLLAWAPSAGTQPLVAGSAPPWPTASPDLTGAVALVVVIVVALLLPSSAPSTVRSLARMEEMLGRAIVSLRRFIIVFEVGWIAFFLLCTVPFVNACFLPIYHNSALTRWPKVTGAVLESGVEKRTATDEDGTSTTYLIHMQYAYSVGGKRRVSDRIYPGGDVTACSAATQADAQQLLQSIVDSRPLLVHYDPAHPDSSALVPTPQDGAGPFIVGLGFFLVFAVSATGHLVATLREPSRLLLLPEGEWHTRCCAMGIALIVIGCACALGFGLGTPGWFALGIAAIAIIHVLVRWRKS